ncbi:DUF4328 domain-containing protein [Actinokineospora sp. 24-640]
MTDVPTPPMGVLAPRQEVVAPNRGARFLASVLILATTAVAGLVVWQSWRSYHLVRDVLSALPTVTAGQVEAAEGRAVVLSWAWLAGLALSWVAFAAWLWRARVNAARIGGGRHRLRIRWAVLGWVVPVVNLWWPQMVVADVYRASRPGADPTRSRPSALVTVWWSTFLAAHAVDLVSVFLLAEEQTERAFLRIVVANAVSAGLVAVSAVAAVVLMWRIDRWQRGRPAIR